MRYSNAFDLCVTVTHHATSGSTTFPRSTGHFEPFLNGLDNVLNADEMVLNESTTKSVMILIHPRPRSLFLPAYRPKAIDDMPVNAKTTIVIDISFHHFEKRYANWLDLAIFRTMSKFIPNLM